MASGDSQGTVKLILKLLLSLVLLMAGAGGLLLSFCGVFFYLDTGTAQRDMAWDLFSYGIPLTLVGIAGLVLFIRVLMNSRGTKSGAAQPDTRADSSDAPQ
jgi:hypothetical protein